MNERLLHFIWKFKLFKLQHLTTTTGEPVELVHAGFQNTNAGPDFLQAKIKIGSTLWVGNVEMHLYADDWFTHKHHTDAAYNNVILHVVFSTGTHATTRQNGTIVPTLHIGKLIHEHTLQRYDILAQKQTAIPCAKFYSNTDSFTRNNVLEKLLIERLESKVSLINQMLQESENDWENVLFQLLAKYLGAAINKEPFLALAKTLPVKVWAKHQADMLQLEALIFGQAGFLEQQYEDDYPNQLRKEYLYLKRLHRLASIEQHHWKFLRLRPSNFPTIRLAQLAALMSKEVKLFSSVLTCDSVKALHQLFDVSVSPYWNTHYTFAKSTRQVNAKLGASMKNTLIINTVVPMLFAYGKHKDEDSYCEHAVKLLAETKPEVNHVVTGWKKLGQQANSAADTQSLLQLKNEYCNKFRCLECGIGIKILQ